MPTMNFNDNFKAAVAQNVNNASGSGSEVSDTGIDMYGCDQGVALVNMAAIAGGSLAIKVEDDEALAGSYGTTSDGDGAQTITATGLTTIELKNMKRYWRIVYTDSAHTKTWSCVFVGWNARSLPIA